MLYLTVDKCGSDEQLFITNLYQCFLPAMIATAQKYVSASQDVEDVVHSAIVRLIDNVEKLMELDDVALGAYILYTTKSVALNFTRHQNVIFKHAAPDGDGTIIDDLKDPAILPDAMLLDKEAAERFAAKFHTLSEEDQMLLQGKYILELSDQHLASILRCKTNSIRMKLTRARRHAQTVFSKGGSSYGKNE